MSRLGPPPERVASGAAPLEFDWQLAFQCEGPRLAFENWKSRCGERPMPRREDLDPVAMRKFTQNLAPRSSEPRLFYPSCRRTVVTR